jgi:hypothetical protein
MTEKEYLETRIKHLEGRKRLMNAEIDFKLLRLNEALSLQKGFEVSGKSGFRSGFDD